MSKAPRFTGRFTTLPAIQFLLAFQQACPRGLGDRDYSGKLHDMLTAAIDCGMPFAANDHEKARELDFHTCVGVFRLVDPIVYARACGAGSTYTRMYEAATGLKPWKAPRAIRWHDGCRELLASTRVAPAMGVLVTPAALTPGHAPDRQLQWHRVGAEELELWWVTSQDTDVIRLGRYREVGYRFGPSGSPAKRVSLSRREWAKLTTSPGAVAA